MSDLIDRLRGKYPVGPIGEDGQPEFGYRNFSDVVSSIELEAADRIESLEAERDGLRQSSAEIEAAALERWARDATGQTRNDKTHGYINALADALDEAARIRAAAKENEKSS